MIDGTFLDTHTKIEYIGLVTLFTICIVNTRTSSTWWIAR